MQRIIWVKKLADFIEATLPSVLSLDELAAYIGLSKAHMQRQFKLATGLSIGHYIRNRRLSRAALDIANTDKRIIDVAIDYDFESQEAFGRAFRRFFGLTPKNLKNHPALANHLSILPLSSKYLTLFPEMHKRVPCNIVIESLQLHGVMQHYHSHTFGSEAEFQADVRYMWDRFTDIIKDWEQQPRRYFTVECRNACSVESGEFTMMAMCTGQKEAHDELVSFTLPQRDMLSFSLISEHHVPEFLTYLYYVYLPENNLFVNRMPILWEWFEDGSFNCHLSVAQWQSAPPKTALTSLDNDLFQLPALQGTVQDQQIPFVKQQSVERLEYLIHHWQPALANLHLDKRNQGQLLLIGDDLQKPFTPEFEFHSQLFTIDCTKTAFQIPATNYLRARFAGNLFDIAEAIEYVKYSAISEQPFYLVHGYEIILEVTELADNQYEILLLLPAKKR